MMLPGCLQTKLAGFRSLTKFDNVLELAVNRLVYRGTGLAVYRLGDIEVVMDHRAGDQSGARLVLTTDMYRRLLPAMRLSQPWSVLDLGANNGGFPLLLHHCGVRLARLCCVEMHPRTFLRLDFNTKANLRLVNIANVNAAICGDGRSVDVSLEREGTGQNIYGPCMSTETSVRVSGVTFDQLIDDYFDGQPVDIIKMDVEGAEYEVLLGEHCQHIVGSRYLIIEVHRVPGHDPGEVRMRLDELGFRERIGPRPGEDVYLFESVRTIQT